MIRLVLLIFFLGPWLLGASACPNAFTELGDKNADAALFFQARSQIDEADYNGAITTLNLATAAGIRTHTGKTLLATAYAGRCGLDLIGLANDIAGMGTKKLFEQLMASFQTVVTASTANTDCTTAEQIMVTIPTAEMTRDDYTFLAFVELAKIGSTLARYADTDDNGVVDGAFNACTTLTDADTRQIGTGITIMLKSITNSGLSIGVTGSLSTLCSALDNLPGMPGSVCDKVVTTDFTNIEVLALHALVKGNEIGLNTCGGATGSSPACACP